MSAKAPPVPAHDRCTRCGQVMPEGTYWCPACGKLNATLRVRTVFILFVLAIGIGFGVTKWYVSRLRSLESSLANRWYVRGEEAIAKNYPSVAIEDYRNALGYDANNQQYRLRLAEALIKEGRLAEARAYLLTLWARDPADARLNLDLARLYAEQNKPDLAVRYYRAAIDGVWTDDPLKRRLDTRFELVRYLMHQGDKARATAELIAIQAEAPDDAPTLVKAGDLLLQLGEYARAETLYDGVVNKNGKDLKALIGDGQAALALGDYRKAVRLLNAANELPGAEAQSSIGDQLALARVALNIDPYLRNLTITERANRVATAFDATMNRLKTCAGQENITLSSEVPPLAQKATKPALPNKQNGYTVSLAPSAAPDSLQLLYSSALQRQPTATARALRRNPDSIGPTMDFVLEAMRATERMCPPATMQERALQLIARHEAENLR